MHLGDDAYWLTSLMWFKNHTIAIRNWFKLRILRSQNKHQFIYMLYRSDQDFSQGFVESNVLLCLYFYLWFHTGCNWGKVEKTNSFYFVFANPHALLFSSYKTFEYCDLFVNYLLKMGFSLHIPNFKIVYWSWCY